MKLTQRKRMSSKLPDQYFSPSTDGSFPFSRFSNFEFKHNLEHRSICLCWFGTLALGAYMYFIVVINYSYIFYLMHFYVKAFAPEMGPH